MLTLSDKKKISGQIWRLAIPNIISSITVPLLSLVDVGLAGHLPSSSAIGAVAIASGALNTIFWLFGFLRMGTTGFVAQNFGAENWRTIARLLIRGIALACLCGGMLLFAKPLVLLFAKFIAQTETDIATQAGAYLDIALLGAPAAMLIYVFNGWFIGMQNTKIPMITAIMINVCNIALSFFLVRNQHYGVEGLAMGTVIAQYIGLLFFATMAIVSYKPILKLGEWNDLWATDGLREFLFTGKDIFIRSAMLSAVTLFFTYASVREGEIVVAANTLLLQFFNIFSYLADGFAYAGEALSGRYMGMKDKEKLRNVIRQLFVIGAILAAIASAVYLIMPQHILLLLSDNELVIKTSLKYVVWTGIIPLAGFSAFLWDGIFVGTTYSKGLLTSMVFACAVFFITYYALQWILANHALWLAFCLYLSIRGGVQAILWHRKGITR